MAWTGLSGCKKPAPDPSSDADWLQKNPTAAVNPFAAGGAMLPTQQLLTPAGTQVELPGMRPQVLAFSPDGSMLATCGITHELVLVDPATGKVLQHLPLFSRKPGAAAPPSANDLKPDQNADASFTGLTFSPDGSHIYLSNGLGNIQVFGVDKNQFVWPVNIFPLPDTQLQYHRVDVPAGLKTSADGKRLYVVLNVSNRLLEMDAQTGQWLRQWAVGDAPYDVLIVGQKAYVSNWGGRRVDATGPRGPIGEGATVRVDPVRYIANEGSVSVLDFQTGKTIKEILTGMHACALAPRRTVNLSPSPTPTATPSASSTAPPIPWFKPSARAGIQKTFSAPAPMPSLSMRPEQRSTPATAPKTPWRSSISRRTSPRAVQPSAV